MKTGSELILASVGSAGDAHPYIALGHAMRARGHAVAMFSNTLHQSAIEAAGIEFIDAGPTLDYPACIANPNLWHPIKGMGVLWRTLLAPSIAPLYRALQARQQRQRPLHVLAGPQMLGARLAQWHLGIPLTTAYTAPSMLRSSEAPVTIAQMHWPQGAPRWLLNTVWRAIDHYKLEPMARARLQAICLELGVSAPQTPSIFGTWMHSQAGLALFPEWFAPRKSDYPAAMVYSDFPLYQLDAHVQLAPVAQAFLAQGPAPVVVMLGTAMAHSAAQFAVWQAALLRTGQRGIFLSAQAHQLPAQPSAQVLHAAYAPFSVLLPHCAAIVHHGGIGTCAQALSAGIPQIIQACAHDQFENARCVAALGVGQRLARDASVHDAAKALQRWSDTSRNTANLQRVQALCGTGSIDSACTAMERVAC
jgi:rhamnosyltransferase subunit B